MQCNKKAGLYNCWHTSWDVYCDHCVTAERDYLLFLSRHFIILESDKYPGESGTPQLMSSQCPYFQDCWLLPGLRVLVLPGQLQPQLRLRVWPLLRGEARQDLLQGPGQSWPVVQQFSFLAAVQWYFSYQTNINHSFFEIMPNFCLATS